MQVHRNRKSILVLICIVFMLSIANVFAQDRFPKPEFETDYHQPTTTIPAPDPVWLEILDIILLIAAMSLAAYFALKKRSRKSIFTITIFSVLYFGFYRQGCVCSVGAIQNFALALGHSGYILPWAVGIIFILPLLFTLFFGRSFCSSVCPLGAVQDLVMVRPVKLGRTLIKVLSLLPYIYLGFAVLFALTDSAFIICRYDPFINIFRRSASFDKIIYTGAFLVLCVLIARPYCRFLCPYGVLLGWMSRLSPRHISITPDECISCRLCEDACPFDAIQKPATGKLPETREHGVKRIGFLFMFLPIILLISGFIFSQLDVILSRVHPRIVLAEQIKLEDEGIITETTLETRTFRSQGISVKELYKESEAIRKKYKIGGWFLGAFLGLVFTLKLFSLSIGRKRDDYVPDPVNCLSCGRCFEYCPKHQAARKEGRM